MPNPISRLLISAQRRSAIFLLPVLALALIAPMTASCQRSAANPDNGIDELRGLVRSASGRPGVNELSRIGPDTRELELLRWLDSSAGTFPTALKTMRLRSRRWTPIQ